MRRTRLEPTTLPTRGRNGVGTSPAPLAAAMHRPMTLTDHVKTRLRDPRALEHLLGLGLWVVLALLVLANV